MKEYSLKLPLLLIFLIPCFAARGQSALTGVKPRLVLVQLSSERNRIEALTRAKRYREANEVKKDADSVISKMMRDFRDHFTKCPVYYYMDMDMESVKAQKFDGVLFDANLKPVASPIAPGSKDYLIVYYSHPAVQSKSTAVVKDSAKYIYNSGEPFGTGLTVCNYKFEQLTYFYKLGYEDIIVGRKKKPYLYHSKHFNIEYYPLADQFNKNVPKVVE